MNSSALTISKSRLKPTVTKVTRSDGKIHLETEQGSKVETGHTQMMNSPGYVVDTTPDLTLSQVLPWLYLSSQDVAADIEILRSANITRILNVASGLDIQRETYTNENGEVVSIEERKVELLDIPEQSISEAICECIDFLNDCKENDLHVLVHCNAGVSTWKFLRLFIPITSNKIYMYI